MFQSPEWIWVEVLVIALVVLFFAAIIGAYIYKKVHHIPTGECACCQNKAKKILKEYRKANSK